MHDTIAAIATAPGPGGVGIVRVSGPDARAVGLAVFRAAGFSGFKPRYMHYGEVADTGGQAVDQVLAVFFPGPNSFTGEDVLELHGHGGSAAPAAVLQAVLAAGARMARPGEFSQRAFVNGKLDLTQAEAVAELVAAPDVAALRLARERLSGRLGRVVATLGEKLRELRAQLCVAVDFPEDDVECLAPGALDAGIAEVLDGITALLAAHARTRVYESGARVVLAGPVNVGKSSLLNAMLGKARALVSDAPGTTRDYIEERVSLGGLPVTLVDTAGQREAGCDIEAGGVELARSLVAEADLVLLVADGSRPMGADDRAVAALLSPESALAVINKADLPPAKPDPDGELVSLGFSVFHVSAAAGQGLEDLLAAIKARLSSGSEPQPGELAPNLRQASALQAAAEELKTLRLDISHGVPYDLLGVRLETACAHLNELTGRITPDEVLSSIFDTFCIGK